MAYKRLFDSAALRRSVSTLLNKGDCVAKVVFGDDSILLHASFLCFVSAREVFVCTIFVPFSHWSLDNLVHMICFGNFRLEK